MNIRIFLNRSVIMTMKEELHLKSYIKFNKFPRKIPKKLKDNKDFEN